MSRRVCVRSGRSKFVQDICVGPHAFQADESNENGGKDAGADPHELLLAALGSCASTTVQMYADRKQWPVDTVQVALSYVTTPQDSGANVIKEVVAGVEMAISFSGDLSNAQKARLLEIAERCPVHRILMSQLKIHTMLLLPNSPE
jgi:putative redox protein